MPTWTSLTDNQSVDHTALQDAVTSGIFVLNSGQTIPADLQCITSAEALVLVDVKASALPATSNKLVIKTDLIANTVYPSDEIGVVVVDIFTATSTTLGGYFDSPITFTNNWVHAGFNTSPNAETAPASAWMLASDAMTFSGTDGFRVQFNLAKVLTAFTSQNPIVMKIRGRASSSGSIGGAYSLKTANGTTMTVNNTSGNHIPGVTNDTTLGSSSWSSTIGGGADGTYNITDGTDFLVLSYDRTTKVLTKL